MTPLSIQQVLEATGARPLTALPPDAPALRNVCTDSRQIEPGCLFVALKGERFDAHDFLGPVAAAGAAAALVERVPAEPPPGMLLLQVRDAYAALGQLAKFVRRQLRGKVVAVAGSNGKTGTKLLIHSALRGKLRGSASPKSFNNNVGVPLTIFPADPGQDYLVLELGTNHPGEIATLADIARPDVAVITNAGAEHLEFLGDLAGVRKENASILSGLHPDGLLVVFGDDPGLLEAASPWRGRQVTFGFLPSNDLFAADVRHDGAGVRFKLNDRHEVSLPLLGAHTAGNAVAAIAVARWMGLSEEEAVAALATAEGPEMRLQLQRFGPVTVLNDAYNANPDSMRAALETLASVDTPGRRVAVLGDMLELGAVSERYHRNIGASTVSGARTPALLVCVGPQSAWMAEAAVEAGKVEKAVRHYADAAAAAAGVPELLRPGDLVLLKASRGTRLEVVAKAIAARWETPKT